MIKKIKENLAIISLYGSYFVIWLIMHLQCNRYGDDLLWVERAKSINSFSDLMNNYYDHISNWSSRIIIDFVGRLVELSPMIIWCILDSIIWVFLTNQIDKIFNEEKNIKFTFFVMCACSLYPFVHLSSAGWMASTFTYLWPLAGLLYAIRIWKQGLENRKVHIVQYVLSVLAFIYAIDQQQVAMCAVLICIVILLIIRKLNPFIVAMTLLSMIRVIVHLKWPGSESRTLSSISSTFPEFDSLSLFDKLQMGVSTTFYKVFLEGDMIFIFAGILLAVLVFEKHKDLLHRAIATIPVTIFMMWGPIKSLVYSYFTGVFSLNGDYSSTYGMIHSDNYYMIKSYYLFTICGIAVICMISSILAVYGETKTAFAYCSVLVIGLCSRIVMGLSPTVYVSGSRTYLFLYFAFIILVIAFSKSIMRENIKKAKWIVGVVYIWGVVSLFNTAIQIPWVK